MVYVGSINCLVGSKYGLIYATQWFSMDLNISIWFIMDLNISILFGMDLNI